MGALRGCPPLERVAEDRFTGWSEGKAFPSLYLKSIDFTWTALYDISKKDENMNVIKGEDVITLDTTSSYIRGGKRTIATIGLDNIVIVDSDDALLVAAKGKIQDVKKVAEEIKGRGW